MEERSSRLRATLRGSAMLAAAALLALSGLAVAQQSEGIDLSVSKTDKPDPVQVGQDLLYEITVTNQGNAAASAGTLTDDLPKDVNFKSASQGCTQADGTVTCPTGALAPNESVKFEITVVPTKSTRIQNTASVDTAAGENDVSNQNDRDTERTTVNEPPPTAGPSCAGRDAGDFDGPGENALIGTEQGETLLGSAARDLIIGRGGDDTISGQGANDLVCAGPGNDTVRGGGGDDELRGKGGADGVKGRAGNDSLFGGGGPDSLGGGSGHDRCKGGTGEDTLRSCEA